MDRIRTYYQQALEQNRRNQPSIWSSNQVLQPNNNGIGILPFSLGLGAGIAAGYIPTRDGKRVWDSYVSGMRHFEEYFLGKIPRTLQFSNIFSQMEREALAPRYITPKQLRNYSSLQLDYLERLTNTPQTILMNKGLRYENHKLFLGIAEDIELLGRASVIRNINKSPRFSTAYARSLGLDLHGAGGVFEESLPFINDIGKESSEIFQIIGGKNRFQSVRRQFYGIGTELVERVNRLAKSPFEFPIIGPLLEKLPLRFGVKPGPGLETLARLTGKLGILGGAALGAYKELDYITRNTDLFNNTIFDQGITAGLANMWAGANMAYAKFGDLTGWTESRKKQEQWAPGSTSLAHLAAFPIVGALVGGSIHYAQRLSIMTRLRARGRDISRASNIASKILSSFKDKGLVSSVGRYLQESENSVIRSMGKSPIKVKTGLGIIAGTLPILPFLFNALAPEHTEDELREIYSGEKEEEVRKGRWWTLGRTPFEGQNIEYYRKNWVARANERATDKAIWGPLETDGEISPFKKWLISNFTYELEQAHYYDRPTPLSGAAFKNIPIIGPILSATIGRLVKPPMLMHENQWSNDSGQYLFPPPSFGQIRAPGELPPTTPITPTGLAPVVGEQIYRMTQFTGLPGFLIGAIKNAVTGSQNFFDQETQLATGDAMYSSSRSFFDESTGDWFGGNELLRRLIPRERNIDEYNPIRNDLPDWLPGPGDRGPDLQHGDPFTKVPLGEERLPGVGYEAAHPELKGLTPDQYPTIWKYKILADVAPYSEKFDEMAKNLAIEHKQGKLSDKEESMYFEIQEQIKARRNKKTFQEYKYRKQDLNPVAEVLAKWNEDQSEGNEKESWFHRVLGKYWENMSHNLETPIEQLTPLSPASKLLHQRTATEDYERTQIWGTENSFWNKPIENFIKPFLSTSAHDIGWGNIPTGIKEQRKINEFFDILKYIKFTKFKYMAMSSGDKDATAEFEQKRRETLFGINPYTFDFTEIYRALPRKDRDYFTAFSETKDTRERSKILSMIPENERGLYIARWQQEDNKDFQKAAKLGLLSNDQISQGLQEVQKMYDDMDSEGLPKTKDLWKDYVSGRLRGETYPDWYRRTKLLPEKAAELGMNIPGPDWVGFSPSIDLDDIKLKLVQNEGETIQDYDLWPSQERTARYRQAVINDKALEPILQKSRSPVEIGRTIRSILGDSGMKDIQVDVLPFSGKSSKVDMDIQEDRTEDLKRYVRKSS